MTMLRSGATASEGDAAPVTDEELRFTIKTVASTAATWQGRIKDNFGGFSAQDLLSGRADGTVPREKPGRGGYL